MASYDPDCDCPACLAKRPELSRMPIGFSFPIEKLAEWTRCIEALREQGFRIIK